MDHKYKMQQREVELAIGPHHFSFWAPERRMIDTTFTVMEGPTQDVVVHLPYSTEYRSYQAALHRQKKDQWLGIVLPSAITLGIGIWSGISYANYRAAHTQLVDDENLYKTSAVPRQISTLKDTDIPQDKQDFKDTQTMFAISVGAFAIAAAGTMYSIVKTMKRPVPVFEDQEKLKFDGLVWIPNDHGGTWAFGTHLDLR